MGRMTALLIATGLLGCRTNQATPDPDPRPDPTLDADIFVSLDDLGDPVPGLGPDTLASYARGREVMERAFRTDQGLGPTFNADSCASCHQFPVAGGSAPRYRDFWLVKAERWDGQLEDVGSNGQSPVRNIYSTHPAGHVSEPEDTTLYARRNTPSGFGVGLFEFVPDSEILLREDPDDADGDGISGRANYEQGRVGRFGYKSQASSLESFNRGAMLNQMGLTSNPLFYELPEAVDTTASLERAPGVSPLDLLGRTAHAQVSAPGQPTIDDDLVADPELSDADQRDLLVFSVFLAPPRPDAELSPEADRGATLFGDAGCADCHTPRLDSSLGPLPAYTDLLLHDMGEARSDGLGPGFSTGSEFRTAPLWGVVLHGPFLHDGAADTLADAIRLHAGEGQASSDAWLALSADDQQALVAFLASLGGRDPQHQNLTFNEASPPDEGDPGGPTAGLSDDDYARWLDGRAIFDRDAIEPDGLGTYFNADSCRACHQDPVLGGAGGIDTSVVRYGHWSSDDTYEALDFGVMPRLSVPGERPRRMPDAANAVELRQPPTALGVGLIAGIADAAVLANHDPDDTDGDGISGRARLLDDGRLGRYGWKAQVPSIADFVADAMLHEVGLTTDPADSDFTVADDGDATPDPELSRDDAQDLAFYLSNLAPPVRMVAADPDAADRGEALFTATGCAGCHLPDLDGVALYSDLLLHDVGPPDVPLVDQEVGLEPGEFRTPPLWGLRDTAPYLHHGMAPTLGDAVELGHAGEAATSRAAWRALTDEQRADLLAFLETL